MLQYTQRRSVKYEVILLLCCKNSERHALTSALQGGVLANMHRLGFERLTLGPRIPLQCCSSAQILRQFSHGSR